MKNGKTLDKDLEKALQKVAEMVTNLADEMKSVENDTTLSASEKFDKMAEILNRLESIGKI